jgi:pimeloyl-ACP methyl ester carboxylesterase
MTTERRAAAARILRRALAVLAGIFVCILAIAAGFAWDAVGTAQSRQTGDRMTARPAGGEFVSAGDARIFVQRLGAKDAPTVVFIHGTGSWSEAWRQSMITAQNLGYQAVAVDLPPFGYSVPPASGDYSKPRQAARLLAALDSLGIRRAVFVAHSFGAAPVMEALLTQPQRASALVLVDAALGLDSPQTDGKDNYLQALLRIKWLSRSISAALLTNPGRTESLLKSFVSEKEKATPEWIRLYQQPLSLSGAYKHVADWLPELVSSRGIARSDDGGAYAGLPYPVTLIWGDSDTITPLTQAWNLQTRMRTARLIRIPKAGHIPQIEEPELFQAALTAALQPAP